MGSFKGLLSKSCLIALVLVIGLLTLPVKPVQAAAASSVVRQPGAVCQLAAGMLYNEAYQTLRNLRVGSLLLDFINPAKRFNPLKAKKSKAYKAVTRLLIAAMVVGTVTCPPIVIRAPFRGQSRDFRVSRALAEGFDPADPNLDLEVENPSDPASCTTTTLYQDVDENTGEIFDFGDFQEMQFVYSEPFGSYPAASKFLREILAERASALMGQMSSWLPSDILPDTPLDDLSDFIDGMAEVPDQYNPSLGDIPGLRDIFELMANQTVIDFEAKFYNNFNHWVSGVLELPADQLTIGNYGAQGWQLEFHDGFHQWFVQADNDLTPTGFNYTQRVFVKEYFVPEFDVLYEIEDPNNPGVMLKVVADGEYEALEPGRADRSYTPPTAFEGSMEAYDNCDPDPKEFIQIPTELSLGIHYFPITAIDRAGNESDLFHVRINVIDSIPPDVNPPESIGIEVAAATTEVNFTDQGIGCTTYLCQNSQPDKQVFPPTYFDFATITPDYNCYASNTMGMEQPCDLAVLPVGEATEVRWEATDPSGNVENIIQYVAIREVGTNQPPEASGTTVTVAAGVTTPIRLQASDPEFDPLSWQINSLPALGQLEVNPEPQFQTRFSISGTMDVMSSIVKLDGSQGENAWNRILVADEGNNRLVEMDSFSAGSEPLIHYTHFLGNVRPSSILFYDYDNSNGSIRDERYLEDLLIADWSTGRIHTLNGPDNSPDSGYDISQWVSNPAHIAMLFDGSDARLFITDPDPVASTNGKLVILRISNFDRAIPANNWAIALEATIDMNVALPGFNPASITASDCNMLLLGDTDVDGAGTGARIATYYYLNNQPGNSGTDRVWDISSLTEDPPGDARPILGQRIELASRTGNCTNLSTWVADDASKEVIPLVLMDGGAINTSAAFRVGTEFVTIQNIESPAEEYFYVLSTERLSRYDTDGVLDALVLLDVPNDNLHNFQQLNPGGKQFIDMSLSANGDLFILDSGIASGQNVAPGVMRLQVNSGFSQFTILAGDGSGNSALDDEAYALSYSPGASTASDDDWVYLVSKFAGLERMSANNLDNPIRLLDKFPDEFTGCAWCGATGFDNSLWDQILDVANDASGNVYFSDLLNRVHKFTDAGEYVGWLGRCDSGTDCDVANGRSYGFSCKLNSCSSTNDAGVGQGQFDFDLVAGGLISSMRPRYGRLTVDNQAGLIYVSDFIDHDGDTNTPRLPRIQSFSLSSGAFNSETRPDGEPGNLLSFLDPGDFTAVNDMAVFGNTFYVAEDLPLERLHVFDAGAFEANLEGATVNYIADSNTSGNDFFEYSVEDSFGAASSLAQVDITVVLDNEPPQLGCPADLIIEGTHLGGAQPSQFLQGEAGSVELADFLEGYTLTDNVSVPEATAVHDGPALFPLGETIVTFTATDAAGNQSVCSASVSVFDTIAPELASGETGFRISRLKRVL